MKNVKAMAAAVVAVGLAACTAPPEPIQVAPAPMPSQPITPQPGLVDSYAGAPAPSAFDAPQPLDAPLPPAGLPPENTAPVPLDEAIET